MNNIDNEPTDNLDKDLDELWKDLESGKMFEDKETMQWADRVIAENPNMFNEKGSWEPFF